MKRQKSTVAQAASLVRQELKKQFPEVKFKVVSSSYSMGNSIRVSYVNGPKEEKVRSLLNKYEYGSFNGMEDIYEYDNVQDFPQTKYLFIERTISDEIYEQAFEYGKKVISKLNACTTLDENNAELQDATGYWTAKQTLYRYLSSCDLTTNEFRETMLEPEVWNTGVEPRELVVK